MNKINNIDKFLDQDQRKDLLRFITAGSVDDGKSTLIGRLLCDSKRLYEDQLETLKRDSNRGGQKEDIDYSLLTDGLKAEREQGITIDVAYRYFSTKRRKFIIADTPGHEQYTRNMITGASTASLAVILIDATAGVVTQTRRHTYLVWLLGIKQVIVAINKMDCVDYSQERYDSIVEEYSKFCSKFDDLTIIPIPLSALKGDNVVTKSKRMSWYRGEPLLRTLESIDISSQYNFTELRYPVSYVIRSTNRYRSYAGRIAAGEISKGDKIRVASSGMNAIVKSIVIYKEEIAKAIASQSVAITLDREVDISRGDMISLCSTPPSGCNHFKATLVWMDENAMQDRQSFYIQHTTTQTRATIDTILYKVDVNNLERYNSSSLLMNEIAQVEITTLKPIYVDTYKQCRLTGSFILIDPLTNFTSAVGMITEVDDNSKIEQQNRESNSTQTKDQLLPHTKRGYAVEIISQLPNDAYSVTYNIERRLQLAGVECIVLRNEGSTTISYTTIKEMKEQGYMVIVAGSIKLSKHIDIKVWVGDNAPKEYILVNNTKQNNQIRDIANTIIDYYKI